jgi:hypothetical protein
MALMTTLIAPILFRHAVKKWKQSISASPRNPNPRKA